MVMMMVMVMMVIVMVSGVAVAVAVAVADRLVIGAKLEWLKLVGIGLNGWNRFKQVERRKL